MDIPVSTTVKEFLRVHVHSSGLFSVPVGTDGHFDVVHWVTGNGGGGGDADGANAVITDELLDAMANRSVSYSACLLYTSPSPRDRG